VEKPSQATESRVNTARRKSCLQEELDATSFQGTATANSKRSKASRLPGQQKRRPALRDRFDVFRRKWNSRDRREEGGQLTAEKSLLCKTDKFK
jgi:hypothetical protein